MRGWVEMFSAEPGLALSGDGAIAAELRQLPKENARLLMEREHSSLGYQSPEAFEASLN